MQMEAILDRLVAFDTVSDRTNLPLVEWVAARLAEVGVVAELIPDATGTKANLLAVIGPRNVPGVVVSAHVDVVPVEGQAWTKPPFALTAEGGRFYGRGTTDMKGFVACAVEAALLAARRPLAAPFILALSHDEEVGCRGVGTLIARMGESLPRPRMCLVGEPTSMQVAVGHKGKVALRSHCTGRAMHSSAAPRSVNAIDLAADLVLAIRAEAGRAAADGPFDADYEVAHSTLHAGKIAGGVQVNIVADSAVVDWEIRSLAGDGPAIRMARIAVAMEGVLTVARARVPEAAVETVRIWDYPGLDTAPDAPVVAEAQALSGANGPVVKVAFGTEGGMFADRLGIPTVICGPGSMVQGHTPDEWIEARELAAAQRMLARLVDRLAG